ncbi:MAG: helix-turn-helix domain-containing protein, partial [Clostridiales bacterium]|nr:helix-turn-helix domain-containing protein [Clostridiales bacterium]
MPAPLSQDLRKRIIRAQEKGDSYAQIAQALQINKSTVSRVITLYKETGSCEPRPLNNGRKPRLNEETLQKISKRIEEQPDITLS